MIELEVQDGASPQLLFRSRLCAAPPPSPQRCPARGSASVKAAQRAPKGSLDGRDFLVATFLVARAESKVGEDGSLTVAGRVADPVEEEGKGRRAAPDQAMALLMGADQ